MKAKLIHHYRIDEDRVIHSAVTAYDEAGAELFDVQQAYNATNTVYATYKALFTALRLCQRHHVTEADIVTNHKNVAHELNGEPNPNARLLAITHERLEEYGVKLCEIKYES